jgi:heme-degrading monooxygenase HmoA
MASAYLERLESEFAEGGAAMLACIIEFGVKPGVETEHRALLAALLEEVATVQGFVSKETFESRNTPGKVITISYWRDEAALRTWMRNAAHLRAIAVGNQRLFTHYTIQIADVRRESEWVAPGAT